MKKVSIIVPVYNAEKYLDKCLDSLVNQTYKNIEIIVIDDKSTDNSLKVLEEYNKKNSNVVLIKNKKNMGIGYTRNVGIKKSNGDYLYFVDSDDYLDLDNIEKMMHEAQEKNSDFVICDLKRINEQNEFLEYERIKLSGSNLKKSPYLLLDINLGPCNKLIDKKLFDNTDLFSETLKYEDLYLMPKVIDNAKKITHIENTYYNYVIHNNSQTTTMDERVFDIIEILKHLNDYFKKYKSKAFKECLEYFNIRTLFRYTLQQKNQKDKEICNNFIDKAFEYLESKFPNWRDNTYYKQREPIKRLIESHKMFTKIYCNI